MIQPLPHNMGTPVTNQLSMLGQGQRAADAENDGDGDTAQGVTQQQSATSLGTLPSYLGNVINTMA